MEVTSTTTNATFLEIPTEQGFVKTPEAKSDKDEDSKKLSKNELLELIDDLNKSPLLNTKLKFGFDQEDEVFYVNVIDSETDTVLRRYPNDQAINFAKKLDELLGLLFDKNA
ncbi:MAG: flagellar protein FlaG [Campylobacterales bacterium]